MALRNDLVVMCPTCDRPVSVAHIGPGDKATADERACALGHAVISSLLAHTVWECPLRAKTKKPA